MVQRGQDQPEARIRRKMTGRLRSRFQHGKGCEGMGAYYSCRASFTHVSLFRREVKQRDMMWEVGQFTGISSIFLRRLTNQCCGTDEGKTCYLFLSTPWMDRDYQVLLIPSLDPFDRGHQSVYRKIYREPFIDQVVQSFKILHC